MNKVLLFIFAAAIGSACTAAADFTETAAGLPNLPVYVEWGDYDDDGDLDIAMASATGSYTTKVFRNDVGTFTDINAPLLAVIGKVAWGDYDNDGDLDLAVAGSRSGGSSFRIYRNDSGSFVDIQAGLPGFTNCSLAWGDYDNDGDLDIAICGSTTGGVANRIYRNDSGSFVDSGVSITGISGANLAWGDYDNDGDLDLGIAGIVQSKNRVRIYRNDTGHFADSQYLSSLTAASLAWGDYDGDGDIDLAVGVSPGGNMQSSVGLIRNDSGILVDTGTPLSNLTGSSYAWGDCDSDGDLDLIVSGGGAYGSAVDTVLYRNDAGTFVDSNVDLVPYISPTCVKWGDFDQDGDLDLVTSGYGNAIKLYRNDCTAANQLPIAPDGLSASVSGGLAVFSWGPGSDGPNPASSLSYNLRVGITPGGCEVLSGAADSSSGERLIPAIGNAGKKCGWVLNLPSGNYFWSVQSVDSSLAGSGWAAEQSMMVDVKSISGCVKDASSAGVPGVLVLASGGSSAYTDSSGYYMIRVPTGWSGNVTAARLGFELSPSDYSYADVREDQVDQNFTAIRTFTQVDSVLAGAEDGNSSWGDYDNDGRLDLLVTGRNVTGLTTSEAVAKIYKNLGSYSFADAGADIGVFGGRGTWGDYDNDGDLDVLVNGGGYVSGIWTTGSGLYRNDRGIFAKVEAGLPDFQGRTAWGDYDNDGDMDLAISSAGSSSAWARIYRNDGGVFSDIGADMLPIYGYPDWVDYDGDSDLDLLLSGYYVSGTTGYPATKLYRNDRGSFADSGVSLPNYWYASLACCDYDNDSDTDIAVCGSPGDQTKLLRNDGGVFTSLNVGLVGVEHGSLAWGDYDNDGYSDLVIAGDVDTSTNYSGTTRIYRNNGNGTFTQLDIDITGVHHASVAWGDCDGDGLLDLVISGDSGTSSSPKSVTAVYRNNCGSFNTAPGPPTGLSAAAPGKNVAFTWAPAADNETPSSGLSYNLRIGTTPGGSDFYAGMSDLTSGLRLIAAHGSVRGEHCRMRLPDGTYFWSVQAVDTAFAGSAWAGEQTFVVDTRKISGYVRDAKGSGLPGVLVSSGDGADEYRTGPDGYYELWVAAGWSGVVIPILDNCDFDPRSRSYAGITDDIAGEDYTSVTPFIDSAISLPGLSESSLDWGDYDDDGDLDLVIMGNNANGERVTTIYRNDSGKLSAITASVVQAFSSGSVAWGDYDQDNYLDLAISGSASYSYPLAVPRLYHNNAGTFSYVYSPPYSGKLANLTDYDNDGDLDWWIGVMLKNTNGSFSTGPSAPYCSHQSSSWADYDNDGDLDLASTGTYYDSNSKITSAVSYIYRNDRGTLNRTDDRPVGAMSSACAWGDYDNDGYFDLALAGDTGTGLVTKIYRNEAGVLLDSMIELPGVKDCSLAWGDCDNDGDPDLALAGIDSSGQPVTRIFRNDRSTFTDLGIDLVGISLGRVAWGDYDNDGDLDLAVIGWSVGGPVTRVYRNIGAGINTPPAAPTGLAALVGGSVSGAKFSWSAASDARTPSSGLTYNLRIGKTPGSGNVFSGMADYSTGLRYVPANGNAQKGLSWSISLPPGVYYWSVQAIDPSFAASPWAEEQQVTVGELKKISGNIWSANNVVLYTSDGLCSTYLANNYYELWVPSGWSGTVTARYHQKMFDHYCGLDPESRTYSSVTTDMLAQDYVPCRVGTNLSGSSLSSPAWGDYDNDGDFDLAVIAAPGEGSPRVCKIYRNDQGTLSDTGADVASEYLLRQIAWGDYDGDGDLDLAICGYESSGDTQQPVTILSRNDAGSFVSVLRMYVGGSIVLWGDYDNDGDVDLIALGHGQCSTILRNDHGTLVDADVNLPGSYFSSIDSGDYDNDGDLDIVVTGGLDRPFTKVLRNEGGSFIDVQAGLAALEYGCAVWGDYDNDGYLDLVVAGNMESSSGHATLIYRNNKQGGFELACNLDPGYSRIASWGDYDNDGDLDLATVSSLFRNDGGEFRAIGDYFADCDAMSWMDYDGDGDIDMLGDLRLTRNNLDHKNSPPAYPDTLSAAQSSNCVVFSWSTGSDLETPANGLSYNLRVGTQPGKGDICFGIGGASTGVGQLAEPGFTKGLGWKLQLPVGTYYWSVQSVDSGLMCSQWSPEQVLTVRGCWKISGLVKDGAGSGVAGVVITPDPSGIVAVTDNSGYYEISVPEGWRGTISPSKIYQAFEPSTRSYEAVAGDVTGQEFTTVGGFSSPAAGLPKFADSAAWGDYDGDGDLDLALVGYVDSAGTVRNTAIFRNDHGTFVDIGANLVRVYGNVAWGDYDNDGDIDLAVSGSTSSSVYTTCVYRNDGGSFVSTSLSFPGSGCIVWGDYDNDGDLDLAFSGQCNDGGARYVTRVYRNDKNNLTPVDVETYVLGDIAWGDYDNDGDLDLAFTGDYYTFGDGSWHYSALRVYRNDKGGFARAFSGPERGRGVPAWIDYDNDGDLDLAVPGPEFTMYRNDNGSLGPVDCGLGAVYYGSIVFGDYDGDGWSDAAVWWNTDSGYALEI